MRNPAYTTFSSSAIWVHLGFVNMVSLETMTWIRSVTHPGLLVPDPNSSLQSVRWASCRMLQMEDTGPQCWLIILLSFSCFCPLLRWELSTHKAKHWQRLEEEVNSTRGMKYYPVVCLKDYRQKVCVRGLQFILQEMERTGTIVWLFDFAKLCIGLNCKFHTSYLNICIMHIHLTYIKINNTN